MVEDVERLTLLAIDLGYASHSHFSSAFRSHFGLTPTAYAGNPRFELARS